MLQDLKDEIRSFIKKTVCDLEEDYYFWIDEWDLSNNYHGCVYWLEGIGACVEDFLNDRWMVYKDQLHQVVQDMYSESIVPITELKAKICSDEEVRITYEAMSSLLLQEYQKYKFWYTVYGSEEKDFYDLRNKHGVVNALTNVEEFPLIMSEDIVGAMMGVSDIVQPSSLYDVFAFKVDKLHSDCEADSDQMKLMGIEGSENNNSSVFTPDTFQYDAVVARSKQYGLIKKNVDNGWEQGKPNNKYSLDYIAKVDLARRMSSVVKAVGLSHPDMTASEMSQLIYVEQMIECIRDDYLYRFSEPPLGLPLFKENLELLPEYIEGTIRIKVSFKIRGVCRGLNEWRQVYTNLFDVPTNADDLQDTIIEIASDIKSVLAGVEKKGDTAASMGIYPRKNLATHGLKIPSIPLYLAEYQALYIIKKVLRYSKNPVINSSFGKDSITMLHLIRRVSKTGYRIHFTNSRMEYRETLQIRDFLLKEWNLSSQYVESKPDMTYWDFQKKYGWNFDKKGDRSNGHSNSERCCYLIKHLPSLRVNKKYGFDTGFVGLRAAESMSRDKSGKRDGVVYVSTWWSQLRASPIIFFSDAMVKEYTDKYNVPQSKLYEMILYDDEGNVKFVPRTGYNCCMMPIKYGYLLWLKEFYNSLYKHLMRKMGLAETLYRLSMGLNEKKCNNCNSGKRLDDQISFLEDPDKDTAGESQRNFDLHVDLETLYLLIESRPCMFVKNLP